MPITKRSPVKEKVHAPHLPSDALIPSVHTHTSFKRIVEVAFVVLGPIHEVIPFFSDGGPVFIFRGWENGRMIITPIDRRDTFLSNIRTEIGVDAEGWREEKH